jgi:hypothetical protein
MSRIVHEWSRNCCLPYVIPAWDLIEEVNSKAFSYTHGLRLPHSQLLHDKEQFALWINSFEGPKVLKTCYGLSGQGHFHLFTNTAKELAQACSFTAIEWQKNRPVLAEPWVKRIVDFSTQWRIFPRSTPEYLGSTLCENDSFGRYRATLVAHEQTLFGAYLPFLKQHKAKVMPLLAELTGRGFFGHIGIDAMVFQIDNALTLQPVVEINARKTMGWVALEIARRHFPGRNLRIMLGRSDSTNSLLPHSLEQKKSPHLHFPKQLFLEVL